MSLILLNFRFIFRSFFDQFFCFRYHEIRRGGQLNTSGSTESRTKEKTIYKRQTKKEKKGKQRRGWQV